MKIPKKYFCLIYNYLFLFISNAKSEVKIIAQVGTEIITNYDLKKKLNNFILTNQN